MTVGLPDRLTTSAIEKEMRAAETQCAQQGLRLTANRALVLRLVLASTRPIKAYEVLAGIPKARGNPIVAYRALDFLAEHGFIHRLASLSAYVACACPQHPHPVPFLICDNCNDAAEAANEQFDAFLQELAASRGFRPNLQTLEIHGLCASCAAKLTSAESPEKSEPSSATVPRGRAVKKKTPCAGIARGRQ
jgi:Fur family zinc uptake transcriptional regulator